MIRKNLFGNTNSQQELQGKPVLRTSFFLLLLMLFPVFAFSQATAKVNANATVIEPIRINKTVDLGFGDIISSFTPGTVTLSPDGTRVAAGVQISESSPGNVSPGKAEIIHGDNSYSLTLPEAISLVNELNPNQVMIIDEFQVKSQKNTMGAGTDLINIGATLNLEANQQPGYYTNTTGFNVTAAYN